MHNQDKEGRDRLEKLLEGIDEEALLNHTSLSEIDSDSAADLLANFSKSIEEEKSRKNQ